MLPMDGSGTTPTMCVIALQSVDFVKSYPAGSFIVIKHNHHRVMRVLVKLRVIPYLLLVCDVLMNEDCLFPSVGFHLYVITIF